MQSIWRDFSFFFFSPFLPYKLANGVHGETQKENSNWCDRSRVGVHRRDEVARPLSICQSLLSRRWSLNAGCHSLQRLFTPPPLGNFLSPRLIPPPHPHPVSLFFHSPFAPPPAFLSQLYKLPLFSLLFPRLQPRLWEKVGVGGRWGGGGAGGHAKRCGIYLSFLAPVAGFHKALWPFSFTPSSLIPLPSNCLLSLPSNVFFFKKRATVVFQANLSPFWPSCYFCSFHFYSCMSC